MGARAGRNVGCVLGPRAGRNVGCALGSRAGRAGRAGPHLMPLEMTRLRVASTVSCTAAVQFMAPLEVT